MNEFENLELLNPAHKPETRCPSRTGWSQVSGLIRVNPAIEFLDAAAKCKILNLKRNPKIARSAAAQPSFGHLSDEGLARWGPTFRTPHSALPKRLFEARRGYPAQSRFTHHASTRL